MKNNRRLRLYAFLASITDISRSGDTGSLNPRWILVPRVRISSWEGAGSQRCRINKTSINIRWLSWWLVFPDAYSILHEQILCWSLLHQISLKTQCYKKSLTFCIEQAPAVIIVRFLLLNIKIRNILIAFSGLQNAKWPRKDQCQRSHTHGFLL